jgi:hypothetical protein
VTLEEAEIADFQFWPPFRDNTEPDLVIEIGPHYMVVEAKLHSGYGSDAASDEKHQLLRQARQGGLVARSGARKFILLTVTDESVSPTRSIECSQELTARAGAGSTGAASRNC